jgi:uncharacterized protein
MQEGKLGDWKGAGVLFVGEKGMLVSNYGAHKLLPEADFQELFVYPDTRSGGNAGDDELRLEDDLIDLEPVLRDAVLLALPLSPLCRDDCPGLCVECGARLADDPEHRHDAPVDPRWAALSTVVVDPDEERPAPPEEPLK